MCTRQPDPLGFLGVGHLPYPAFASLQDHCSTQQALNDQFIRYAEALNGVPQPPARPRNIDPTRRMIPREVEAFNRCGLLSSSR